MDYLNNFLAISMEEDIQKNIGKIKIFETGGGHRDIFELFKWSAQGLGGCPVRRLK